MLLSNQKFVDPKIARKLHDLQTEHQKLLRQKYSIQNNQKLQCSTRNTLLKYNQTNRYQARNMIQKYKLLLVEYFDEQVNHISKKDIKDLKDNKQDNNDWKLRQQDMKLQKNLHQQCQNQLNSTNDKIQDNFSATDISKEKGSAKSIKYSVDLKSNCRSTNNKSSFYSVFERQKILDNSLEVGEFNITNKFQRLSSSRPQSNPISNDEVHHKQKISSMLQNYNRVSSIYYKDPQKKQQKKRGSCFRRQKNILIRKIQKKDRIIQNLLMHIQTLHQNQINFQGYQKDQINLLSRISQHSSRTAKDSFLKRQQKIKLQRNKQIAREKQDHQNTINNYSFLSPHSTSHQKQFQDIILQKQQLLNLHRQKNILLQGKVKKLQEQLNLMAKNQMQTDLSYNIQLNSIINKNKQLQKIQNQNQKLKIQRKELMQNIKDFNKKMIK